MTVGLDDCGRKHSVKILRNLLRGEGDQKLLLPLKKKFGERSKILVGRPAGRGSIGVLIKEGLNQAFPREFVEWETVFST